MQTVLTLEVFLSLLLAVALGAVAGIVAGIGFIGAGTIWAEHNKVTGITTAASLWATAAIGLTTGIGDYLLAVVVTLLVFIILASNSFLKRIGLEQE